MDRPDAAAVRPYGRVDWAALGYPAPTGSDPDPLELPVAEADAYVEQVTGRLLDDTMPASLDPLALRAVIMRTTQIVEWEQADYVEDAANDLIQSFTAGSYSETRRTSTAAATTGIPEVNVWRALNDLLWLLMTPAMRDYWRQVVSGHITPATETQEVAWSHPAYPDAWGETDYGAWPFPIVDWPGWGVDP